MHGLVLLKEFSGYRVHKGLGLEWVWVPRGPGDAIAKIHPDPKAGIGDAAVEETEGREVAAFMIYSQGLGNDVVTVVERPALECHLSALAISPQLLGCLD